MKTFVKNLLIVCLLASPIFYAIKLHSQNYTDSKQPDHRYYIQSLFKVPDNSAYHLQDAPLSLHIQDITASPDTLCAGETSNLQVTAVGGSGTLIYNWEPAGSLNFTDIANPVASPAATTKYFVTVTDDNNTVIDSITVVVLATPNTPGNPTSNSPQCATNGVTLIRSGTPPAGETWYWQTSPTGTSTTYSGATYTVYVSNTYYIRANNTASGCWSPGAGSLSVIVYPVPSAPPNPTSNTPQCADVGVTLNRTGSPPSGQAWYWQTSASGTSLSDSNASHTVTASGTVYIRAIIISSGCWSNGAGSQTVTVNPIPAAPTGSATQLFCSGLNPEVADLAATGTNIKWYTNSSGGSPLPTSTPLVTNTHYYASQTVSSCESASRLDVLVTINQTPQAPGGSSQQSFCSGTNPTVADLTATGTDIKWYAAASGGSPLSSATSLTDGNHYFATQTVSGCESTSRLDVLVTVITTPPAPAGSATQVFCSGINPTVANLTASGSNINWYSSSSGGSPLPTSSPLINGTHYFASQTVNGCESIFRLDVLVAVNPTPAAPGGSTSQSFCSSTNPTVNNLVAAGTNIKWYATSTGGSPLGSSTALISGSHYYASQTTSGCESILRLDVTVNIIALPIAATVVGEINVCRKQLAAPYMASTITPGYAYSWTLQPALGTFPAGSNTSPTFINWGSVQGTATLTLTTIAGPDCDASSSVIIHVLNDTAPEITNIIRKPNSNILICDDSSANIKYQWGYIPYSSGIPQTIPGGELRYVTLPHDFNPALYNYFVDTYFEYTASVTCTTRSYMYPHQLPIGLDELNDNTSFPLVYPNPAKGFVNISFPENYRGKKVTLHLFDVTGRLHFKTIFTASNLINLTLPPGLQNGLYLLELQSSKESVFTTRLTLTK